MPAYRKPCVAVVYLPSFEGRFINDGIKPEDGEIKAKAVFRFDAIVGEPTLKGWWVNELAKFSHGYLFECYFKSKTKINENNSKKYFE